MKRSLPALLAAALLAAGCSTEHEWTAPGGVPETMTPAEALVMLERMYAGELRELERLDELYRTSNNKDWEAWNAGPGRRIAEEARKAGKPVPALQPLGSAKTRAYGRAISEAQARAFKLIKDIKLVQKAVEQNRAGASR